MKKIMIVDDEMFVRVGIKSIVNWEEHGYQVVAEAGNGCEALEKIKQCRPQIVLTDLMMDKMDGFELISQCRKTDPEIKFIVLSSYNDFDNVRRAMKLGAADYIFKLTAKPEDMLAVLDEISREADEESAAVQNSDSLLLKNLSAIKTRLIRTAIQQSYVKEADLLREFSVLELQTDFSKPFVSLYLSIDDFYTRQKDGTFPEIQLLKFSVENVVNEILRKNHRAETYQVDRGDMLVLVHPDPQEGYEALRAGLEEDTAAAIEYVRRYLGVSVSASLSELFTGIGQLKNAVEQNLQTLPARFLQGGGRFYSYDGVEARREGIVLPQDLRTERMGELLDDGNFGQIEKYMEDLFDFFRKGKEFNPEQIRIELMERHHRFRRHAVQARLDFDGLQDGSSLTLYEAITRYDLLSTIEEAFFSILRQYQRLLENGSGTKLRSEIAMIRQYVRENLNRDLSVQAAAKIANMSESYFSHLFKSETGVSFVQYVNQERIRRAETLLRETDGKISEIAFAVGIDNPNYFSILFKKLTGKSPNEYRN